MRKTHEDIKHSLKRTAHNLGEKCLIGGMTILFALRLSEAHH